MYLKEILDSLYLISFIKTSGNKGLQVYIPLPDNTYSYDDTRHFTHFLAKYLVQKDPDLFTIERLKEKRGHKLYIDYLQHAEGKTIIAPYSPRGNEEALVAAPLMWEEVNEKLRPEKFSISAMKQRIESMSCPFADFEKAKDKQNFSAVIENFKPKN